MIENAIDNILTKLAERDYWDIEILWNRFGVELPILEWLDSQGLIELRKVSLYQDTNTTERTKLKPWYSPTSTSESWWKYFPRTSSDRKQRKPWRTVLPDSKVKIFDLFKNSPVELRVSVAGREMLTHRVAMSAQRKLMQVNDARLHASISSVDAILSRPVTRQASVQGSSTPVNSDDEANDSEISLSTPDFTVLQTMHEFDGSVLLSVAMIRDKSKVLLSPPTIGKTLKKLIKFKYAERPQGERAGTRLTRKGNKLAVNAKKNVQIDD